IAQSVSSWAPWLLEAEFLSSWAGLRPKAPDERPYIGLAKSRPGLAVATGHFSTGILLAPITGRLIADLATGKRPSISEGHLYDPERLS
ncbi:MAG: FAD-dependent oxidoreductase, partial [Firmicutes bacterium]|nr:FAD-dependent oxidoreductase [Bacillota bacterium]